MTFRVRAVALSAMMAVLTAMTTTVRLAADARVDLTVRLFNSSGVAVPTLIDARDTAQAILRDGGLGVRVRHCGRVTVPGTAADTCAEPLQAAEVVVRVIAAPTFNTALHPEAFGVTYVVQETNRGWLATVFSDRIEEAAARAGVDSGTLLGRVMAHEIGHLLLGSAYHGPVGVMRAEWPDALLTHTGDDWRFSTSEVVKMHRVLASIARIS